MSISKFWETETPVEVRAEKNTLRWYPKSGYLQVSRPDWEDDNGKVKPGKTVTLNVGALAEEPENVKSVARSVIKDILTELEEQP